MTGQHDDLASMMALVCDEIRRDMRDIQRQVAPHVGLRRRYMAALSHAEFEQRFYSPAAPVECGEQMTPLDFTAVYRSRNGDTVFGAQCLDPHATGVVQMPGDHADRTPRRRVSNPGHKRNNGREGKSRVLP